MGQTTYRGRKSGLAVVASERFADHVTPAGHPERVERARVMSTVAERWGTGGGMVLAPRLAARGDLQRVHADSHLDTIEATAGRSVRLEPDTYTSPSSAEVARLAAGAVLEAVDYALEHDAPAMALVRPPGHHAERNRPMGFCLYNNIAVAAAYARSRGVASVAVVDYDVHHGNGTQWIFYEDPTVLFVSIHQYPFYPGTGAVEDVGAGPGRGFTVNLPLAAGAGDADYALVWREAVLPVLEVFSPELILLSAGYDAHTRDPLGGMNVSTAGFEAMTRSLRQRGETEAAGRVVAVTEGGYDLVALNDCLDGALKALSMPSDVSATSWNPDGSTDRAEATLGRLRGAQGEFWPTL